MSARDDGGSLSELVAIMRRLLGPDGCPWDREQTFASLRRFVMEEAFEVVDALDSESPEHLQEELGDLVFQVVFLAELARGRGWFGPDDVISGICEKLVRRHPHVFGGAALGGAEVEGAEAALASWDAIKKREKEGRGTLEGVPVGLPALLRAVRIGEKAARVGYDWPDAAGARRKVEEELAELDEASASGDRDAEERELGDLLFAISSLARKRGLDPEAALRGSLDRFGRRFSEVEREARGEGVELEDLEAGELDRRWERAKRRL
jgi:tetrapyrrole methylase family protein/MazG family protein/ATP diphosphatase